MPKLKKSTAGYYNVAEGIKLDIVEIGLKDYVGIIEPDLAFWNHL